MPPLMLGALVIVGLALAALLAATSVKFVPPWAQIVVFRFGQSGPGLVFGPGWRFLVPIADRGEIVDMREQTLKLPRQTTATRDGTSVGIEFLVRYQIVDALTTQLKVYNFRAGIGELAATQLRATIGQTYSADVQIRRVRISEELQARLAEVVAGWGGRLLKVEIGWIGSPDRTAIGDSAVAV